MGCVFLSTTVFGAPIPGVDHFSYWNDFEGMFDEIYIDTQELDVTAICERVLEWPNFSDEGKLIFSLEDCEELAGSDVSSFVNAHSKSLKQTEELSNAFAVKYSFEKQLWQEEHDLQRQVALSYIWNDGDGGANPENKKPVPKERTSPIDLVFRWNEIDDILFGELAEYPNFLAFKESKDKISTPWPAEPAAELWFNQQQEVFDYDPFRNYSDNEISITGGYEGLARMFEEKLNAYSLISGKMTTQTFDAPFTGSYVPNGIGMHVDGATAPAVSPDVPAQITVRGEVPMKEFDGIFPLFFRQQSTSELRESFNHLSNRISDSLHETFITRVDDNNRDLMEKVDSLLRELAETRDTDAGLEEFIPLQKFNTTLDVWIDILNLWKQVNEEFVTHPTY